MDQGEQMAIVLGWLADPQNIPPKPWEPGGADYLEPNEPEDEPITEQEIDEAYDQLREDRGIMENEIGGLA